ncbi:Ketoglutarate semialdehyde dehydrogenase [Rubellimicrobium mesophilum DSM 19309]|uniref:Ketoglutarate semialdehyde dehydrogenase n=1 Tax=Rubellimicrobium mesophilum DSM 19309 TaxID=442562 RepID=A0A017HIF2_9RHOB|nr:aldehyde dehydrogenase (NADP(+)) [Rubellimicrobium mesophilum]EYD74090.1 Ketoglutarate semialdehyde dehydrogenase [Rubellimicrobium mesophilum DSM 19309]
MADGGYVGPAQGRHLIAGEWVSGEGTFRSSPWTGEGREFAVGSPALVDRAVREAEAAFPIYSALTREERAAFLERIAEEIDARGPAITEVGHLETGLPKARMEGERGRTTGQLRLFASHIRKGDHLDRRHDAALPDRQPLPRPDLKLIQLPIGPVAVFGASNFPLAFSVAGGDTASALAAGCPVVVKGHSAHPGTGEVVAEAILAAIEALDLPLGVFSLIQGGDRRTGEALVQHPLIKAVGFTGSLTGGRALFDLCARRPEPIPFFGELGSVNPMFVLPEALRARGNQIATGWVGSLTMGAGQFCTNPGIAVAIDGEPTDAFARHAADGLAAVGPQTMLTDGIASAYREGSQRVGAGQGVRALHATEPSGRNATPFLYEVSGEHFLSQPDLAHEVFGPLGLLVRVTGEDQMVAVAEAMEGQLTATLQLDGGDHALARRLTPILERKAGRLLANGFPTGVEVTDAMVHGGPYPASTNFGATSVGTLSIRRWLRPVSFQNWPEELLPEDLKGM